MAKPVFSATDRIEQSHQTLPCHNQGRSKLLFEAFASVTVLQVLLLPCQSKFLSYLYFFLCNCSILLSHVHGICHADVHQNKLILLMCNGGIEEIDFTAEGGVVAGDLTMKMLQLHGKYIVVVITLLCKSFCKN